MRLTPLPSAVRDLRFEKFERVEAEVGVGDLDSLAQDGTGFVLDKEEAAVGFVAGDLLHDVEEVDDREEVSERVRGDRCLGERCGREPQLIYFRKERAVRLVQFLLG